MNKPTTPCANLNHRRPNPTVRHCPTCGKLMNAAISAHKCVDTKHAERRKAKHAFCMDCGEQLIN